MCVTVQLSRPTCTFLQSPFTAVYTNIVIIVVQNLYHAKMEANLQVCVLCCCCMVSIVVCSTWSSLAEVCLAESATKSWSHQRYVFPRRLKLWSHCALWPRSRCQLKQNINRFSVSSAFYWPLRKACCNLCRMLTSLNRCILLTSAINNYFNSQLQTVCHRQIYKPHISKTAKIKHRLMIYLPLCSSSTHNPAHSPRRLNGPLLLWQPPSAPITVWEGPLQVFRHSP